ncbi:MAG: hypothetical protein AUH33_01295 [Chloroflexi bacterium 13_1_40CM_68_21]|nr:MAG: hypothetical protein AUH33_01295 [Chloroflexi bacterium 13_1_40CM_68_21]
MKLLLVPVAMILALLSGAGWAGPVKDSLPSLFTSRDELAHARSEIADLRYGRGAAAPEWVARYADALCRADVNFVTQHTDASLGLTPKDIETQFARMHDNGLDCSGVRYLGSVGDRQFVFALRQGNRENWYVFTLSETGEAVAKVE